MTPAIEMLVPIAFFAMVVLIVYFSSKFSYQTKKAILDAGGNIETSRKKFTHLEWGMTIVGVGLGLAFAVLPQSIGLPDDATNMLSGACILLFGGLGLISAHFIRRRLEHKR